MNFGHFYLDKEKDMVVELELEGEELYYTLKTPNHKSGNLIKNLAKLCELPLSTDENGLYVIQGKIPCYIDGKNRVLYAFRLGNTKIANIYPDGSIEVKASIPSISKTLMSQTKKYKLDVQKTIIKTYILNEVKFETDVHTHMNANLSPDILIALGIMHQIRYPLYYVKKLNLRLSKRQQKEMILQRQRVEEQFIHSSLEGKYLTRKIDDNTFINFADLMLGNIENIGYNINRIRASLAILKDGQAVFTNLEKVYLYRYVFTKGVQSKQLYSLKNINKIRDHDISETLKQIQKDHESPQYQNNTLFQDKLLWIARTYQKQGIHYVEISDTTLVKRQESIAMLEQVHTVMPHIYKETGVRIRFLAAIRRIPLTLGKEQINPVEDTLKKNLNVLKAIVIDPYVAGSDIVGEEVNDIKELKPLIQQLVKIAKEDSSFVIRIHAGENDGLKNSVRDSIACVKSSLEKGQKMPQVRIGHGLYTTNLNSAKGKELIQEMKDLNVILEFQITSNVRLNNLTSLENHPLKQYLKAGIQCVQGTDGQAIYGTSCIDEQLSLEKLLNLTPSDLEKMREVDRHLAIAGEKAFQRKEKKLQKKLEKASLEEIILKRMAHQTTMHSLLATNKKVDAYSALSKQIEELPWDKLPIIIAGGSFNSEQRQTKMTPSSKKLIDELLARSHPQEVFFVIGHTLNGYEKYLVEHNDKGFQIFCIVPLLLSENEVRKIKKANLKVCVSPEITGMGVYKSFNYEIFERRPSLVFAFDGNVSVMNLIQEAHNGKGKAMIFVSAETPTLKDKAQSLSGYVEIFNDEKEALYKLGRHKKEKQKEEEQK